MNLQHCNILYADEGIWVENSSPTIQDCYIAHCNSSGIRLEESGSNPDIMNNEIVKHENYGINNYSGPQITAENNWWGHSSGPYHPTLNPSGEGSEVSDNVDFDPWSTHLIFSVYRTNTITNANITEDEGSVLWVEDLNNYFDDPDDATLSFTARSFENKIIPEVNSSSLNLKTRDNEFGLDSVIVEATNGRSIARDTFKVNINGVNDPPYFSSNLDTIVKEDALLKYTILVNDPDGDTCEISAKTLPYWLAVTNQTTNSIELEGTPDFGEIGDHTVVLYATDNIISSPIEVTFTVSVASVNDNPVFTSTPITTAGEDIKYEYKITTFDEEGQRVRINPVNIPAWCNFSEIDDTSALLSGIPTEEDIGTYGVEIQISDGITTDNIIQSYSLSVINGPDVIDVSPDSSAVDALLNEPVVVTFDEAVFENQFDHISLTSENGESIGVYGIEIINSNQLKIEHDLFDALTHYRMVIHQSVVQNAQSIGNDTIKWSFKTTDNHSPIVSRQLRDTILNEGFVAAEIDFTNVFEDLDGDPLNFSALSDDEAVATTEIQSTSLTLHEVGFGTTNISLTANDGQGGIVSDTFKLTVNSLPFVSNGISDTIVNEGFESFVIDLGMVFKDSDDAHLDKIAFSNDESVAGVSLNEELLTVNEKGWGDADIIVSATDDCDETVQDTFNLIVNTTPTIVNPFSDTVIHEGTDGNEYDLTGIFHDTDGDDLVYSAESSDPTILEASISNGTLTLYGIAPGTAHVTIKAYDKNSNVSTDFKVIVNDIPELVNALSDQSYEQGFKEVKIDITDVFADNDSLSYEAESSDNSVVKTTMEGSVLTLEEEGTGNIQITIQATDPYDAFAEDNFLVEVIQPTSLNFLMDKKVVVSPNPFTQQVQITGDLDDIKLSIINISGNVIYETKLKGLTEKIINLGDMPGGLYLFKFQYKGMNKEVKMIKD